MTEKRSSALTRWLIAAIVVIAALIFVVTLVRRSAEKAAAATEEEPYTLDNSAGQVFAVTAGREGQLVAATNGGIQVFSPEGMSAAHELMSFKQPGVSAGERAACAYDIGAETLVVTDLEGGVTTIKPTVNVMGNELYMMFDADKLMSAMNVLASATSYTSTLSNLLGNYNGLKLGWTMTR